MNLIKEKIYNIARKSILKSATRNIGSITEEDDKFICYVDQKRMHQEYNDDFGLDLDLTGFNYEFDEKDKKVLSLYNLTKPIYYVFDNITFDKKVALKSIFCKVIFKNCTFKGDIQFDYNNDITFENNKYLGSNPLHEGWPCYMYKSSIVYNLTFKDENLFNKEDCCTLNNFGIQIEADNINFINTNIDIDNPGDIYINASKITAKNSTILAREIYLDSDSIDFTDSLVSAKEGIIIDNEKADFNKSAYAPVVVYNGKYLDEKDETELDNARKEFITQLKAISNYCKQLNDEKALEIRRNLDNKSVLKVLKK